jgi:hypothetical protein
MKNQIYKLFFGKNAYVSLLVVFAMMLFVGLGCGGKKDGKPVSAEYHGAWTGSDGSTITIRSDNSGDYKSGSTKVDNGSVTINDADKTLSITLFGFGPTLKIDQPPSGNQMKLDGIVYKKSGAPSKDTSKSSDKRESPSYDAANASKWEIPSDEEMRDMTRTALMDFNDAVKQGDFTDFHSKISKTWQKQTTPATFNISFAAFIDKKVDLSDVDSGEAKFSPEPSVERESGVKKLIAKGCYDITPRPLNFKLQWIPEGKEYKLFGIEVDTTGTCN